MVRWHCKCGKDDRDGGSVNARTGEFTCIHCIKRDKMDEKIIFKCDLCKKETSDPEADLITIKNRDLCNDCASKYYKQKG